MSRLNPAMFLSDDERRRVEDKALEQILRMAHLAHIEPQDLGVIEGRGWQRNPTEGNTLHIERIVMPETWPFPLTEDDREYLRSIFVSAV